MSRQPCRAAASALVAAMLVAAGSSCVDDPVSPRDPQHSDVGLALQASISGLPEGTYTLRLLVTYPNREGVPTGLPVTPESVAIDAGQPTSQGFTITDMSPCPQGCLLTATLILSDERGDLDTSSVDLGLVQQGDRVTPSGVIQLVPNYTLTITGGGDGTGSGTISVPEVGGRPALNCSITDGQAAPDGCSARYPLHTTLSLTATQGLVAWGGDCSSSPAGQPCELTIDGHRSAQASFAPRPTAGVLIVQIAGLPNGIDGSVTVTNQRSYSNTLTRTDTLPDLSPGSDYTVTAASVVVSIEGPTYDPGPVTQPATVLAGDTAVVQVGYNPPETGSLAISISGLPSSIPAQLVVSGPGLSQPVPVLRDTTLSGLEPNAYTIVTTQAGANDQFGPYTPTPTNQDVEVQSNQTSQTSVEYVPTTGVLSVAISGLPPGNPANVTLTGPNDLNLPITGTRTLPQLGPGGYTVTSGNVVTPGHTFAPDSAGRAVQLSAGQALRLSVGYRALPAATLEKVKGDSAVCSVNSFCEDLFEVRARDAIGNVVSGATVRWAPGEFSKGCSTEFHTDLTTDVNGISSASNECKYPTLGIYHQTAVLVVGGQILTGTQLTFTFALVPGSVSPDRSTIVISPTAIRTCCDTAAVTVTARDGGGNPIPGSSVVLGSDDTGVTPVQPGVATDGNGVTSGGITARVIGTKTVTATINGIRISQTANISVTAGIAYTSAGDNGAIIAINADGSRPFDLTAGKGLDVGASAWEPDGSRIAFSAVPSCPPGSECFDDSDIYVMNVDGSNLVNLTDRYGFNDDRNPTWSPDGPRIAFTRVDCSDFSCNGEIYVVDAAGSAPANLTNTPGRDDDNPSWSADDRIAFDSRVIDDFCDCTIPADIYVMTPTGSDTVNLTHSEADESAPAWSPDARQIAFVSNNVYVMNRDGSNPVPITHDSELSYGGPAWSPDGRFLAFSTGVINVVSLDGTFSDALGSTEGGFAPTWR